MMQIRLDCGLRSGLNFPGCWRSAAGDGNAGNEPTDIQNSVPQAGVRPEAEAYQVSKANVGDETAAYCSKRGPSIVAFSIHVSQVFVS